VGPERDVEKCICNGQHEKDRYVSLVSVTGCVSVPVTKGPCGPRETAI
jgi:hypothetical protein